MPKIIIATPIANNIRVGAVSPVTGIGLGEAVGVVVGVAPGEALGEGNIPESDAVKAGFSLAWTMKFLVRVLVIPFESIQEIVIE